MSLPRHLELARQRNIIRSQQWERLRSVLDTILITNPFHRKRLEHLSISSLDDYVRLCPLMTKRVIVADRESWPPYGSNLSYPLENYTRFCQTSGTTGQPLTWLDSRDDWNAMLAAWNSIYDMAFLEPGEDRLFFPFSFGPFLGFWTAFEAASRLGCMVIPGGGMSTVARLQLMLQHGITVFATTPSYAMHMGEERRASPGLKDAPFAVRLIIVAGEPGGSQLAVRARLGELWPGARIFDHHGLTETGPVSCEDPEQACRLRLLEDVHFAEIIDPATGEEVMEGAEGELVLTTLNRLGCPMLRYRTGDLVRKFYAGDGALCLDGGILGRLDDMVCVRGVNVYPSALDGVIQRFPEVREYQVREVRNGSMLDLKVIVEVPRYPASPPGIQDRVAAALRDTLQIRIEVEAVPEGTLPRFEFKARRWIKERLRE